MRVGFMSGYNAERIAFMKKHGFGSVELQVSRDVDYLPPKKGWQDKAAAVKTGFEQAGVRISCVAGFYDNHMDADKAKAGQLAEHVRNCILLAEHMGVGVVAGFSGRLVNEPLEASVQPFKKIWGEHAKFAEDHGIKIAFEHCPMGQFHSPLGGINCICTPAMWERCFDVVPSDAIGLEWDPSHLICQLIDPVQNLRQWAKKVYHVHAKDAKVYRDVMDSYGIYHPGSIEHCFPGVGDSDWAAIIKELRRAGYDNDLNIEGWHDAVYRDFPDGPKLEDVGLLIALRHLSQFVD